MPKRKDNTDVFLKEKFSHYETLESFKWRPLNELPNFKYTPYKEEVEQYRSHSYDLSDFEFRLNERGIKWADIPFMKFGKIGIRPINNMARIIYAGPFPPLKLTLGERLLDLKENTPKHAPFQTAVTTVPLEYTIHL